VSFLLRQARRSTWSGDEEVTEERRVAAVASFGRRPEDTDGISVFAVKDEAEVALVVAALACTKREIGPVDLLRLEDDEVTRSGVVTDCAGNTAVLSANPLHRVLNWPPEKLAELVSHLLAMKRRSTRHNPAAVVAALLTLTPADVEAGAAREWLAKIRLEKTKS